MQEGRKMGRTNTARSRFHRVLFFGWVLLLSGVYEPIAFGATPAILTPVPSISYQSHNHIHGLGYDSKNNRLFIATHYGIFVWKEGKLFQLGQSRDDFMGFSLHPSNFDVIYTSGHPKSGGNMGVMKSEDGGVSFKQIFRGLSGETVDFHSMIVSPANPSILYGWFDGRLYRTKNSGKHWEFAGAQGLPSKGLCWGAPCFSADGGDERTVYSGTLNGLLVSRDFGDQWTSAGSDVGGIGGIGVNSRNSKNIFGFTEKLGLAISQDAGKSWKRVNEGPKLSPKEFIFAFAFDPSNANRIFAATGEQIFQSTDAGKSWNKIL
jgi:photosystem II stability/assembly factor-like uncharacterized protein